MAGDIRAGRAYVELYLQNSRLIRGLQASQSAISTFGSYLTRIGSGLSAMGGGIVGALGGKLLINKFTAMLGWLRKSADSAQETGTKYAKLAKQYDSTAEAMSSLSYAAEDSDVKLSDVTDAIDSVREKMLDATQGSKEAMKSFAALGVSWTDLASMGFDDQVATIADAFASMPNDAERTAVAMRLFGKGGKDLAGFFGQGAAGIRAKAGEGAQKGLVVTTEDANKARAYDKALKLLKETIGAVGDALGNAIMPILTEWAGKTTETVKGVLDWVKANRDLVATVFKVGAAILSAGTAFLMAGGAMSMIASALGGFLTAIGSVGTVLAALISPVGMLVIGIGVLAYKFVDWRRVAETSINWVKSAFGGLVEDITRSGKAIKNALAAGDITAAWTVVVATLNLEIAKLTAAFHAMWYRVKEKFYEVWDQVALRLTAVMNTPIAGLEISFIEVIAKIKVAWLEMVKFLKDSVTPKIVGTASDYWTEMKKGWAMLAGEVLFAGNWNKTIAGMSDAEKETAKQRIVDAATGKLDNTRNAKDITDTDAERRERQRRLDVMQSPEAIAIEKQKSADVESAKNRKVSDAVASKQGEQFLDRIWRVFQGVMQQKQDDEAVRQRQSELDKAIAAANAAKPNGNVPDAFGGKGPGVVGAPDTLGVSKSLGTFSARAVSGLGGGTIEKKLDAIKLKIEEGKPWLMQIAENTKAGAAGGIK